jgi:TonB-linked SusC/RagA family outer membrane protein
MRKLWLLLAAVLAIVQLQAQTKTITGKVTDSENGGPVPNASVLVKGTNSGTTTNPDGTFTLNAPASARVLVISAVGFSVLELTIGDRLAVDITLNPSDRIMQEVVVVGYGTQQKKAFTGSASKVDAKQFSNLITPSVDKQLAGRAAGVQVTTSGGLVNSPARIRIRGITSISGNNDPLIVVDGIPIINGNLAGATNSNAIGDINPADIESIDVLKDGSATAIYGSRAAPGVILITTKKGDKNGRVKVNYDVSVGVSNVLKRFDLLNASEFVTIANEKYNNAGQVPQAVADPAGTNTDWQKEVFLNNAFVHNHTLSLAGGTAKTTYYMSINFSNQQGVVFSNKNRTYRVRLNLEHEVNKFIKVGNNITLSRQEDYDQNNGSNSLGGSVASTLRLLPNVSPYNSANVTGFNILFPTANSIGLGTNLKGVDDNWFNVAFTLRNNKAYSDKYRIINNAFVEVSPVKGLKLRSQASADFFNDMSLTSWDPRHGDGGGSTNGYVDNYNQNRLRYVWQNYFTYNLTLKSHNFIATGGHELQGTSVRFAEASGQNISDIFFVKENIITNSATIQSVAGNLSKEGFESLFGRFNYDFANKYFIQGTIRRDGLSSLHEDYRYGTFPGLSIGWRPSEEKFWGGLGTVITDAKLRGSFAKVGNALTGFPYLSTYSSFPYGNVGGIGQNLVGNPILIWETSKKIDVGLELSFLKNRISLTLDWFKNDIDNMVLNVPTPPSAGVPGNSIAQNIATQKNVGIEVSVNADIVKKNNFTWSVNANYTNVQNEITSLYDVGGAPVPYIVRGSYNLIKVGQPIDFIYGYRYAGVNSSNGNPVYINRLGQFVQQTIPSGAFRLIADKNNPTPGASTPLIFDDKTNLGVSTPTWFGAVTNFFTYKSLSVEVMLRYSGGNKIMNVTRQDALFSQSFHNNGKEILDRWTTAGQETDVPKVWIAQSANLNQTGNATSRFVEKGDYVRLQNLVISYTVDNKKLESLTGGYIKTLRVFAQGQNLYVWSKYKGADPDNISTQGIDNAVSPQIRTISAGINVGF